MVLRGVNQASAARGEFRRAGVRQIVNRQILSSVERRGALKAWQSRHIAGHAAKRRPQLLLSDRGHALRQIV